MRTVKGPIVIAVLSTLLMVLYAQLVLGYFSKCYFIEGEINAFGLTFGYDETDVLLFFQIRDIEQLKCYKNLITIWDNIFPILYTLTNILWLRILYNKRWLIYLFPLIQMFLDWTENTIQSSLVDNYMADSTINFELIHAGSLVTSSKWITAGVIYFLILMGIVLKIRTIQKIKK